MISENGYDSPARVNLLTSAACRDGVPLHNGSILNSFPRSSGEAVMKTILVAVMLFCAASLFAQTITPTMGVDFTLGSLST